MDLTLRFRNNALYNVHTETSREKIEEVGQGFGGSVEGESGCQLMRQTEDCHDTQGVFDPGA